MEAPIDPGEHTVSELEQTLEGMDDPEELDAILEAERDGEDRTTAVETIEARLGSIETAITENRAAIQPIDSIEDDVLTLAGPDEDRELSERLLTNLSGIRSTLENARQSGGQYEARLRKLENEVGDLSAYTDALEEFLDEYGTAQQVLDSVQSELAALGDDIDDLKPVVRSHAKTLRDHRMTVTDLEDDLDSQESTLDSVIEDVDSLDARFENFTQEVAETNEAHADRFGAIEHTLDEQADRIDDVADEVGSMGDAIGDVATDVRELDAAGEERFAAAADERAETADRVEANAGAIDGHATTLDQLAGTVDDLDNRLGDTARVDDRFARIEEEIEEITRWRDQLGSVLGGSGGSQEESGE